MKTLDDQVPSGYFEDLPRRTLGRLENDMQSIPEGQEQNTAEAGGPPQEEDSGLHDIRSLATSQRLRLKRTSQDPIGSDDDMIASSSAGWKAVALPEPAKVVSLPELAELPEKSKTRESKKHIELGTPRPVEPHAEGTTPIATARARAPKKGGGKAVLAVVGLGLAAAAGVTLFISINNDKATATAPAARAPASAADTTVSGAVAPAKPQDPAPAAATPTVQSVPAIATEEGKADGDKNGAAQGALAESAPAPKVETAVAKTAAVQPAKLVTKRGKGGGKDTKDVVDKPEKSPEPAKTKPTPPSGGAAGSGKGEAATGGLDDLLKEAGVQQKQGNEKPKLDKKSLDGSDIRTAMSAVAAKAQACYQGQQGTANVKLSVAPSGKVQKVTVTGAFANTPVGACVAAAVKGATFPPWDGGPQSVSYSYLLSE